MHSLFIDGGSGTTGLRIKSRLAGRDDIQILNLPEEKRKDSAARREMLNSCDVALLCLPDDAAREAVSMVENPHVRILDSSTAHRTAPGWVYGFPEICPDQRGKIQAAKRIAVPGCHASGFIALVRPLIDGGILPAEAYLTCHSVTGYSGGGKGMIAQYEAGERPEAFNAPRQYALTQNHKHLREMQALTGLSAAPIFCPIVADFYSGMAVTVPLFKGQLLKNAGIHEIMEIYRARYTGPVVALKDVSSGGFWAANAASGTDKMYIHVMGNEERILLTACYDNLGKGASGAAVQVLNLILGAAETQGLEGI